MVIGRQVDQVALTARLDACLLTDDEMGLGLCGWSELSDPFPCWSLVSEQS